MVDWTRRTLAGLAAVLLLAGCGGGSSSGNAGDEPEKPKPRSEIEAAHQFCMDTEAIGAQAKATMTLQDEGHSVSFDTAEDNNVKGVACVFRRLDTPDRIVDGMDATTAMMGRQKATQGDLTYEWSYHPDSGLQLVVYDDET